MPYEWLFFTGAPFFRVHCTAISRANILIDISSLTHEGWSRWDDTFPGGTSQTYRARRVDSSWWPQWHFHRRQGHCHQTCSLSPPCRSLRGWTASPASCDGPEYLHRQTMVLFSRWSRLILNYLTHRHFFFFRSYWACKQATGSLCNLNWQL